MFYQSKYPTIFFAGLTSLLLLTGCNSADNSNSSSFSSQTPIIFQGKTTAAQITQNNQAKIYAIAQGELGSSIATGAITASNTQQSMLQNMQALNNALSHIRYTQPESTIATGAVIQPDTQPGSVGGTVTWSGNMSPSGVGQLTAEFVNYNDGSGTLNGTIVFDIRASNTMTGAFTDMTASYNLLEFQSKTAHTKQSGSYTLLASNPSLNIYQEVMTFNQDFVDVLANTYYRYQNLTFTTLYNNYDPQFATSFDFSISGRIYEQYEGYIDIQTNTPFHYTNINQINPDAGTMLVHGANGSLLQVNIATNNRIAIALDSNGDGIFESGNMYTIGNEFGTPAQNSAPVITTLNLTPQDIYTNTTITVDVYGASDPDGDALIYSYTWKINGTVVTNEVSNTLPSHLFVKNDIIEVTVSVSDGISSASQTVTTTVLNSIPAGSVSIIPNNPTATDTLTVQTNVTDTDNDTLSFSYEWVINGAVAAGQTSSILPPSATAIGYPIIANVTVSDGSTSKVFSANTTILAKPVVITPITPAPATTLVNQAVSFQVTATQGDGLPVSYTVLYGPDGMTVDAYGFVNWLPQEPMFETTLDINFAIRAQANTVFADYSGTIQLNNPSQQQPIVRQGIRLPNIEKAIHIADMDNDGKNEIIMLGRKNVNFGGETVSILRFDGVNYIEDWTYPFNIKGSGFSSSINSLTLSDLNADGTPDMIITYGNNIAVIDGLSRQITAQATFTPLLGINIDINTEVADLDGDGNKEIIAMGGDSFQNYLHIFDAATLNLVWESSQTNLGQSFAIGNVDNDASLEIVTSNGFVFDGTTRNIEWNLGASFGTYIDTGDLDGDGIEEIIALADWAAIRVFSAVQQLKISELIPTNLDFNSLNVANIDADPYAEIIVGDGQWGNVTAYDGLALTQAWSISAQDYGTASLAVGDSDNDGQIEIIWAAGIAHSGPDRLVVAGINPTVNIEWSSNDLSIITPHLASSTKMVLDGPFTGAYFANTSLAGQKQVLFASASTSSGYHGTRLIGIDPYTSFATLSSEQGSNSNRTATMCVVDYDADGIDETFLATSSFYNGYFSAYDFQADIREWTSPLLINSQQRGIATVSADINANAAADLISLTNDGVIYIYDMLNQALLWQSPTLAGNGLDIAVRDLNGDGIQEIITLTTNTLSVFERLGASYVLRGTAKTLLEAQTLEIGDANGDGLPEIFVSTNETISFINDSTDIHVLDGLTLNELAVYSVTGTVTDILYDKPLLSEANLLLSVNNSYSGINAIQKTNALHGGMVWNIQNLLGKPQQNSAHLADINNDGKKEIMFGTDHVMYISR